MTEENNTPLMTGLSLIFFFIYHFTALRHFDKVEKLNNIIISNYLYSYLWTDQELELFCTQVRRFKYLCIKVNEIHKSQLEQIKNSQVDKVDNIDQEIKPEKVPSSSDQVIYIYIYS